jgi:dolichol-phosphate mannosyltransferase
VSARLVRLLALAQAVLGLRVAWRLLRTGRDTPICATASGVIPNASVAIVVPVLNEVHRLRRCLDGAVAQGAEVGEILVVDSGSEDGTRELAQQFARCDSRVRLVEAGRAPTVWNGKVWGLHHGERALSAGSEWVLMLDADVAPSPGLAHALVSRARSRDLRMLSVATRQEVSSAMQGVLHPAMLASLVYRFGRPNGTTSSPAGALANGQCCLIHCDLLRTLGGFEATRASLCEDVTLARQAALAGERVGFFEAGHLVRTEMYADWRDAWRNWPRSLVTRDAFFGVQGWLGLLEVLLAQALPLPLLLLSPRGVLRQVNLLLVAARVGLLVGIARAYSPRPWSFWFSPLVDLPVALALWSSAFRPRHTWRGRTYVRQKGSIVAA